MENTTTPINPKVLRDEINRSMREVGIPPHLDGYGYIKTGLEIIFSTPDILRRVTTELYPRIAMVHDTIPSRVERGIRHAIEATYHRNDPNFLCELMGLPDINKGKLTNSEFLARMSENIRMALDSFTELKDEELTQSCKDLADDARLLQLRQDLIALGVIKG